MQGSLRLEQSDKFNVLWVDDEIKKLLPHILALDNNGFKVFTASSRTEAESILEKENFHIIVSDLLMPPPGNPVAFLETAKTLCPKATICVISGYLENNEYRRALEKLSIKPVLIEKPLPEHDSQAFINLFKNMTQNGIDANITINTQRSKVARFFKRLMAAIEIKPGIFGIRFDFKKFFNK